MIVQTTLLFHIIAMNCIVSVGLIINLTEALVLVLAGVASSQALRPRLRALQFDVGVVDPSSRVIPSDGLLL